MGFYKNAVELIGNTPLVDIRPRHLADGPLILAKIEFLNPGGSIKDRLAKYVVEKAMAEGKLKKGDTVIDNTSGNMGIGLAMVAAAYGLKAVLTTAEKTSQEKVDLIRALGAEVIVTPTEANWDDPASCYQVARRLAKEKGYFYFNQYDNPDNPEAHYKTTGPEIWEQTDGKVTHLVGGIGTGGTISGAAQFLKEKNPDIKIIAVDPPGSLFAEYIRTGQAIEPHNYLVEGIGSDKVTGALYPQYIDEVITVTDEDSFAMARQVTREFGITAGGSSGTAAFAAYEIAPKLNKDDIIVVIFADSATRYLSKCFSDKWMKEHGFKIREVERV